MHGCVIGMPARSMAPPVATKLCQASSSVRHNLSLHCRFLQLAQIPRQVQLVVCAILLSAGQQALELPHMHLQPADAG